MAITVLKSVLHNIGVVVVGFIFALLCTRLDLLFGIAGFKSLLITVIACVLVALGFLLRVWATYYFYKEHMKVIVLAPQKTLITSGPYYFSRNPLYLGGNVCIFFGAALLLGSPIALLITVIHLPLIDLFIKREEKQLERTFGEGWLRYKKRVPRWF